MRKALVPMLVSLALCGAATTAMVISSARAQPSDVHKPMLVAGTSAIQLAQNDAPPPQGDAPPRDMRRQPGDFAARLKQICQDESARETGRLAYLEARLNLTPAEQTLFQRWKTAKLAIAQRHADACAQRPAPQPRTAQNQAQRTPPSPVDMMAREEDRLKQRLADIEAERPAMDALYASLTQEQKMELMRAGRHDGMEDPRRGMFADARGPQGPMDRGPMDRGPMGPGMGRGPMGPGGMDRPAGPPPYGPGAPPPEDR